MKLTRKEAEALAATYEILDAIDRGIRKTDWDQVIDLSHRSLTHGVEGMDVDTSESAREVMRRRIRNAQALRVADNALLESKRQCRCDMCARQMETVN